MATKLKSKIKSYLSNIWLIEIVIILCSLLYFSVDLYKSKVEVKESMLSKTIERVTSPEKYFEKQFEKDIYNIGEKIFNNYTVVQILTYGDFYYWSDSKNYLFIDNVKENGVKFIIRNTETGQIMTNDENFKEIDEKDNYVIPTKIELEEYINSKYKKVISKFYSDETVEDLNPYLVNRIRTFRPALGEELTEKYDEYYYTTTNNYSKSEIKLYYLLAAFILINIVLILKVIMVTLHKKGNIKLRGNFIYTIYYVLRYGFLYHNSRRGLIITISFEVSFFVLYLYFLALGGYENNIIVKLFTLYPFKAGIVIATVPIIGVLYSMKKSIEIYRLDEKIRKINNGETDFFVTPQGSQEIKSLIEDMLKMKEKYNGVMEEIIKNEKLKTELISNVSHDLRTPLTSIINYVNIIKDSKLSEEERKEYIDILDIKSHKLKVLIDDLFEMSKINSGKMQVDRQRIEIMSLIYQVIGEYSYMYEDKNVEFIVDSTSEDIFMELDGKMMSRVIENIAINALKYSLEQTRIYADVVEKEDRVIISFKNIANYNMKFDTEEIFERFVRGDKSRSSDVEGSGLGLAITKSLVELQGGKCEIKTEGDMFKIYVILPKTNCKL